MGCIESLEEKYHEIEERFKQIFEADKFFVENMQFVSLCHAYKQEEILADFQFMEPDKNTKQLLRNFMNQFRQLDFVLIARLYIERIVQQNRDLNLKSLEDYSSHEKFGEDTLGIRYCLVKQQLLKQYQEFLEVERQNAKLEKLKGAFRTKINDINLQILLYQNMTNQQKLDATKKLVDTAKEHIQWQEYRSRLIAQYFQNEYKNDVQKFKLDDKHTVKDESEFIRKFNQFEREDSAQVEERYKKQCRFHRKLFNKFDQLEQVQFEQDNTTVNKNDIRYMSLTHDAYLNYAKYLEDNMAKLIKVYEDEYQKYQTNQVHKDAQENDKKERQRKQKELQDRRDKEKKQTQEELNRKQEELKNKTKEQELEEARKKVELEAKKKQEEKEKTEARNKLTPEERKKQDDLLEQEEKAKKEKQEIEARAEKAKQIEKTNDKQLDLASQINDTLTNEKNVDQFLWYVKNRNDNKLPGLCDVQGDTSTLTEPLKYWNRGLKTIAKGRVALVLLAGDSDQKWFYDDEKTPLGFQPTGLNSQKCLFQLFCERVEAVQRLAHMYRPDRTMLLENSRVHVYVMTNPDNDYRTRKLFRKHLNFGLWKANIHFFEQPQFPALDPTTGQIKLRDKLRLHMMPDGTGGFYDAVLNDKLLNDWDFWGIKYVHVMGIDNLLGRPVDPTLIGMLRGIDGETPLEFVTKAVKVNEKEQLPRIVISSEVDPEKPNEAANKILRVLRASDIAKDSKKSLAECQLGVYNDFACNVEFIKKVLENKKKWETFHETLQVLPYYVTPKGHQSEQIYFKKEHITEDKLKSLVYERDIYDAVVLVSNKRFGILEVSSQNEYAPIKPVPGKSFSDAVVQLSNLHYRWLLNYGYQFEKVEKALLEAPLEKKVVMDQEQFKVFIGEKTVQERQRELKLKADCKAKLAKNKKLKKINEMLESSDEEDETQNKQLSRYLVEIDARQSIHGENIPQPPIYQLKEKSDQEEELPQIRRFKEEDLRANNEVKYETYPFYLKCQERPIKLKLPWGLNEIYRYI